MTKSTLVTTILSRMAIASNILLAALSSSPLYKEALSSTVPEEIEKDTAINSANF